jgi:hypothetical protein
MFSHNQTEKEILMADNRSKQLDPQKLEALKKIKGGSMLSVLAGKIGLPRSTLGEVIKFGKANAATMKKIDDFLSRPREPEAPAVESRINFPKITGNEKPLLKPDDLLLLFARFGVGLSVLRPVLEELANGDVGTRMAFRKRFGKQFDDLLVLARSLASEAMRAEVLKQLGKDTIP